jgi:hypothetical protein
MQPTCQLIRRPLAKKTPWRKWATIIVHLICSIIAILTMAVFTILALAL